MRGNKYGWGYWQMRKDSKNSKSENEVIVSSIIDKSEEKVIKGLTKKDIADGQNAIKTKQSSQKKVLSTEETKIEPGIKEKEISVLEDDKDLKEKTKVTAKKTTAKRSTAVKSSSRSQKLRIVP